MSMGYPARPMVRRPMGVRNWRIALLTGASLLAIAADQGWREIPR